MKIMSLFAISFILLSFSIKAPEDCYPVASFLPSEELYTSEDGTFEVDFGGEPTYKKSTVPTDVGDIEMGMYMYEKNSDQVYMVAHSDYDTEYIEENNSRTLLDGGRDGALESLGIGAMKSGEYGKHQGYPSLDFTAENDNYSVMYKLILVDGRLYQIAVLTTRDTVSKKIMSQFINSFKLLGITEDKNHK